MIIENLADYLEANDIGVVNDTIFIEDMPFDKSDCVTIISAPSPDSDHALDMYNQTIEVDGRFTDTELGLAKMEEIFNLLHKGQNYEINGFHIYYSNAIGMINNNGRDVEGRRLYNISFKFIYRIAEEIS